jgi:hypothetical protein
MEKQMIEKDVELEQETHVRHTRTGGEYVIQDTCKMKIGENNTPVDPNEPDGVHAGWVNGVIYYDYNDPDRTFVRDEAQFREKFELTEKAGG